MVYATEFAVLCIPVSHGHFRSLRNLYHRGRISRLPLVPRAQEAEGIEPIAIEQLDHNRARSRSKVPRITGLTVDHFYSELRYY